MSKLSIIIVTILIGGAVADLIFAYYVWKIREARKGAAIGAGILLAGSIWMLCWALEMLFSDFGTKMFFKKAKHIGVYAFPILWFVFCLYHTGREKRLTPLLLILVSIIPFISFVLVITNEFHSIFWNGFSTVKESGVTITELKDTYYQFVLNTYVYFLFFWGCFFLVQELIKKPVLYRTQIRWTVFLFILVACVYTVRICFFPTAHFVQVEPVFIALISVPYCLAFYRWRISDIVPVANQFILEGMHDPVVVLDEASSILKVNDAACSLFETKPDTLIGLSIQDVMPHWPDPLSNGHNEPKASTDISLVKDGRQLVYNMKISPLFDIRNSIISQVLSLIHI